MERRLIRAEKKRKREQEKSASQLQAEAQKLESDCRAIPKDFSWLKPDQHAVPSSSSTKAERKNLPKPYASLYKSWSLPAVGVNTEQKTYLPQATQPGFPEELLRSLPGEFQRVAKATNTKHRMPSPRHQHCTQRPHQHEASQGVPNVTPAAKNSSVPPMPGIPAASQMDMYYTPQQAGSLSLLLQERLDKTRQLPLDEKQRVFKELQRLLHPDKNPDRSDAAKLAFQQLMDQRKSYLR